jgi:hypothetical protein
MRALVAILLVATACGGNGGNADDTGDDDGDDGDDGGPDAGGGGDGGSVADAAAGGSDAAGGPDAAPLACAPGIAPTHMTTMSSTSLLNYGEIVAAGGRVFATAPFGVPATTWLRWTGSAWSQEAIPWPANMPSPATIAEVVQLASGDALLVSNQPAGRWITTFDGFTMTPALEVAATAGNPWAYTKTSDGQYHVFGNVGTSTGSMHVHVATDPGGGWYPADPLPITAPLANEEVAAATAGDRLVVAYTDVFFDDEDPVHVHVLSRTPTSTWTAVQDITPTWAVRAYNLRIMAPPGGGVIVGASGAGSVVWRSPDGLGYGEYEQASAYGWLDSIHAQCLENPIVVAGYQTAYRLEARVGGSWTTLRDRQLSYITDGGGVILPDGKTYLALGETNQHEYFATP